MAGRSARDRHRDGAKALLGALKDERLELRMISAEALGRIGDARAVGPLIEATRDVEGGVRADAAEALTELRATASLRKRRLIRVTAQRLSRTSG